MIYKFEEMIGGFNHLGLRLKRKFLNQPVDFYLRPAMQDQVARPISFANDEIEVCSICGFALARVTLANDWTLETCSATGLRHVLRNKALDEWSKKLGKSVSPVGSDK